MCARRATVNPVLSKPGRARCAPPGNPCSTEVGFLSTKTINQFVYIKSYLKYIETGEEFQHPQTAQANVCLGIANKVAAFTEKLLTQSITGSRKINVFCQTHAL